MREVFVCAMCNVSSGACSEDCAYCTKSAHYDTKVPVYKYKAVEDVLNEARKVHSLGALGLCLVSSGRGLDEKKAEYITSVAKAIKAELPLHLIGCCGSASVELLKVLKDGGVDSYNHNLESAKSFFPNICTTHPWEERYQTCLNAIEAGLGNFTGGIFGLGESKEQREEFLTSLASLNPHTVPINFFMPHPNLPIKEPKMSVEEALWCVKKTKEYLPNARLMLAGGREAVFGQRQLEAFEAGADGIVLGDYLTQKGDEPNKDIQMLNSYGIKIATICH